MKFYLSIFALLFCINLSAQTVVTTTPIYPSETDQITIRFDVSNTNPVGKTPLINYTGDVYAHTGVYINNDNSTWKYVIGIWGQNGTQPKVTFLSSNVYQIVINNPRTYYGVGATEKITSLNFVLRSSDGSKQTEDIKIPLYSSGFSVVLTSPTLGGGLGDPMRTPAFVQSGGSLSIDATTTGTATSMKLLINGTQVTQTSSNTLSYSFVAASFPSGRNDVKITAVDNANRKDSVQFVVMSTPAINNQAPPVGTQIGINYGSDPTKVTLAFYAPKKNFVYVIGEFGNTDWKVDNTLFMNKYAPKADSVIWWTTISGLESGKEYSYQFLVDGTLRIYDPYTEKILDANNDPYIPSSVYPNLKSYPTGKTSGLVSVLQTNQTYNWNVTQFARPAKEKLIIYELLVRDFVYTHSYSEMMNKIDYLKRLGINAVELMPVMEFEGNDSWGYNPTTYFAPDKYYGTKNALKAFIDACHQNGIAVILDIVLNHAYNSNSMAQLYWDSVNNRPAADNPWFNVTSPNSTYSWGNDFNHTSKDTKYFVDRVTSFWLTEYKADGFRFDFSKGFTNTTGDGSAYDASRIAILERIASKIWSVSPTAYVILEHFAANSEEIELSNYVNGSNGIMLWGNLNSAYSNAVSGSTSANFNNVAYNWRGMTKPAIVGYMESHDEERVMVRAIANGFNVASGTYRTRAAGALFVLVPGPKMIWQFGELGYDYSIDYNGRLGTKPIKWDYYENDDRRNLYYTFAYLNGLKKNYPVFSSSDYTLTANFSVKSLYLNHASMNAAVFANFDIVARDYQTQFQSTGTWYEFFSGQTLNVTDTGNTTITLQPGEFRLYTSQFINKADVVTAVQNESTVPKEFNLSQNYPNPFNPSTVIKYSIPNAGNVTLKVYDMLGREVVTLVDGYQSAGTHSAQFSIQGSQLASGIYLYRIQAGAFTSSKKMVLIK